MREGLPVIRGFRVLGERKKERSLSVDYLLQSHDAVVLQRELWKRAQGDAESNTPPAPCLGDDRFTSDDLPSDREAAMMCSGCPLATFQVCQKWAEETHLAHGVAGGKVYGRALAKAMAEDD